jgi:hypothetical protein
MTNIATARTLPARPRTKGAGKVLRLINLLHAISAAGWFGGVIVAGALTGYGCSDPSRFQTAVEWVPWVYTHVVLPSAIAVILEGLWYGFFSKWGFVKHRWILLKWLLTLALAPCTALTISQIMTAINATTATGQVGNAWAVTALPLSLLTVQIIILIWIMAVSVYKPRLRKK